MEKLSFTGLFDKKRGEGVSEGAFDVEMLRLFLPR